MNEERQTTTQFEIVLGAMSSGKTTYAKRKKSYKFLSHDQLLRASNNDFNKVLTYVIRQLNKHPEKNFIIDGWFSIYNLDPFTLIEAQKKIPQSLTITCLYVPIETLVKRTKKHTREKIVEAYLTLVDFYVNALRDLPFTFRDDTEVISFEEFLSNIRLEMLSVKSEEVDAFRMWLGQQPHDRTYQSIILPYEKTLQGYERTATSWDVIRRFVDFRGLDVLDAGCHHAYCSFAAEGVGARRVVGIDRSAIVIEVANRIREIWNYRAEFICADLDGLKFSEKFDVVLFLNTIQHCRNPLAVAKELFAVSDLVIVEADAKYDSILTSIKSHSLLKSLPSPRKDRKIGLYVRNETDPCKFQRRSFDFRTLNVGCGKDLWGDVRLDVSCSFYSFWKSRPTILADAQHLPFKTDAFQEVKAYHVLEHLEDPRKSLEEICRVATKKIRLQFPAENDNLGQMVSLLFDYPPHIKSVWGLTWQRLNHEHKWVLSPESIMKFLLKRSWASNLKVLDVPIFRIFKYRWFKKVFKPLLRFRMKESYTVEATAIKKVV